jgi:hypothetical protein
VAFPVGWLVSNAVLALAYYGLFAPLGLAFRLAGRDPLNRRREPALASYLVPRAAPTDARSYLKQY